MVATGTASGKSLAYLLPALTAVLRGAQRRRGRAPPTALYLSPTKALAADQLRALAALDLPGVRAATYDGDTPGESGDWVRQHATYVLTNPDMLHRSMLPGHAAVGQVPAAPAATWWSTSATATAGCSARTWRRCCAGCGGSAPATAPTRSFVLASATVGRPGGDGAPAHRPARCEAVTEDGSPRGAPCSRCGSRR